MNAHERYTEAQLDLLRRIEQMDVSDEMRRDIREMRNQDLPETGKPEVVKGESRVRGFTTN